MGTMVSPWSGHHLSLSPHSKVSLLLPETFLSPLRNMIKDKMTLAVNARHKTLNQLITHQETNLSVMKRKHV